MPGNLTGSLSQTTLDDYFLNKYCGQAIEGSICFNDAAIEFNSLVDKINAIGKKDATAWMDVPGENYTVNSAFDRVVLYNPSIFPGVTKTDDKPLGKWFSVEARGGPAMCKQKVDIGGFEVQGPKDASGTFIFSELPSSLASYAGHKAYCVFRTLPSLGKVSGGVRPNSVTLIKADGELPLRTPIDWNNPQAATDSGVIADAVAEWHTGRQATQINVPGGTPRGPVRLAVLQKLKQTTAQIHATYTTANDLTVLKTLIDRAIGLFPKLNECAKKAADAIAPIQKASQDQVGVNLVNGAGSAADRAAAAEAARLRAVAAGGAFGAATQNVSHDIKFKEQCVLLSQITTLAQYRRNLDLVAKDANRPLPYKTKPEKNAPLVVDGESFGFMNKLTQWPGMRQFFDMTTAEISGLQPLIRLYKVRDANSTSAKSTEQEIDFDSYAKKEDLPGLLTNKDRRGFGAGIKSFNLIFDGQDIFAQKKSIKATLKIQANSFSELLKKRGPSKGTYRYIDLALKTGKTINEKYPELDELNFRLKAVFGYTPIENSIVKGDLAKALKGTFVSVNLTPVTHNFDFDDLGRVTFTIEYLAYVDEFYNKPRMNIFTHAETYITVLSRKIAFDSLSLTAKCEKNADAAKKVSKKLADQKKEDQKAGLIEKEKKASLKNIFDTLLANDKIYFLNLSRVQLKELLKLGPYYEFTPQINAPGKPLDAGLQSSLANSWKQAIGTPSGTGAKKKEDLEASLLLGGIDSVQIPFFYVGDLLNLIIGNMAKFLADTRDGIMSAKKYETIDFDPVIQAQEVNTLEESIKEFKKFRVLLGPLELVNHSTDGIVYVNFADVPVSVKYMSEWLTSKLLKKDQAVYPLVQFMKDLFNDLIKKYLNKNDCYPFSIKQKVRLFQSVVTSYPTKKTLPDEITAHIAANKLPGNRLNILKVNESDMPLLNISGKAGWDRPNPGFDHEMNYFVFYAGRTQPMNLMNGKRGEDEDRGIFHYVLGKDRGILKTIRLNKTSSPGLKEVRFEQEGYDGLRQLREIYDVDIDSYANVRAFPGNYIFVDPRGFDPSLVGFKKDGFDLTDLGVGGYFMIIRSEHEFGPGLANTKLTAVWVAAASSDEENKMIEEAIGANNKVNSKCHAWKTADAATMLGDTAAGTDPTKLAYTGNKVEHSS